MYPSGTYPSIVVTPVLKPINNIAEATYDQFLALSPCQGQQTQTLDQAIDLVEKHLVFLKECEKIQEAGKEKIAKLQGYNVHSQLIVDKFKFFAQYANPAPVLMNGIFNVYRSSYPVTKICGLCGHRENGSYTYRVINTMQPAPKNELIFETMNIHAITAHKNFSYTGQIGQNEGCEISVFDSLKILELIK